MPTTDQPIFIHSLWRAGSTYVFQAFRRSPAGYWPYQEPIHEAAFYAKDNPDSLTDFTSESLQLRHPHLNLPYFYELQQVHAAWRGVLEKRIIYDDYFGATSNEPLKNYFHVLIASAKSRPVIQECRTSSRIGISRKRVGGTHLYLWRNPWDQWWSFKIGEYFNTACLLILNAQNVPPVILRLREEVSYEQFHDDNINEELGHFQQRPLSAEHSYLVFYILWCLGLLEGHLHADLMINIDCLSESSAYNQDIEACLNSLGVPEVDFSDCHIPQGHYFKEDCAFFNQVEDRAHGLLLISGYTEDTVDWLINIRRKYAPLRTPDMENDRLARDLKRARRIALRYETTEAGRLQNLHHSVADRDKQIVNLHQAVADRDK